MIHYLKMNVVPFFLCFMMCNVLLAGNGEVKDPDLSEIQVYGKNKQIPEAMKAVILTALSHYPELKETRIEFIYREDIRKSVMQAQPKFSSILRSKRNRRYKVNISRFLKLNDDQKVDIETLPFDVLVGWIGHELGHIMDYKDRGSFGMISFGAQYVLSDKYVTKAERRADMLAMQHGLGENIMMTKNFVMEHKDIPLTYKNRIKRLYMSPEEFEMLLGDYTPVTK